MSGVLLELMDVALLKDPLFIVLMVIQFFSFSAVIIYMFLLAPLLVDLHYAASTAATMLSLTGITAILWRFIAAAIAKLAKLSGNVVLGEW